MDPCSTLVGLYNPAPVQDFIPGISLELFKAPSGHLRLQTSDCPFFFLVNLFVCLPLMLVLPQASAVTDFFFFPINTPGEKLSSLSEL